MSDWDRTLLIISIQYQAHKGWENEGMISLSTTKFSEQTQWE